MRNNKPIKKSLKKDEAVIQNLLQLFFLSYFIGSHKRSLTWNADVAGTQKLVGLFFFFFLGGIFNSAPAEYVRLR